MKPEIVPRKCSTCIRKGCCKDQKRFEVSASGRCSRQHVSRRAIEAEIVRLKIAHLRRMADACEGLESRALAFAFPDPAVGWADDRYWRITEKVDRFRAACLAKIAKLKESQCSIKS